MRITDLVNNPEFCFNVPFRILQYTGPVDETYLVYDSETMCDEIPWDIAKKFISAINYTDGYVEIEYVELI